MRKLMLFLIFILFLNCEIFEMRGSESPNQETQEWVSIAFFWENITTNLELAFENNIYKDKYPILFDDSFHFYFSEQDISNYDLPNYLNKNQEKEFIRNFHSVYNDASISLKLNKNEEEDNIFHDEAIIYREYFLTINQEKNKNSLTFSGDLKLILEKKNGIWVITEWYDYKKNNTTLGVQKYELLF